jgi:hypothetical protein
MTRCFDCKTCAFLAYPQAGEPCIDCEPGNDHGTHYLPNTGAASPGAIYKLPEGVKLEDLKPGPLTGSIDATLSERGSRYGTFKSHSEITKNMFRMFQAHMGVQKFESMAAYQQEALHMIFHKLGRIANGDPNYADSWVDIAGYAKLVADGLEGVER